MARELPAAAARGRDAQRGGEEQEEGDDLEGDGDDREGDGDLAAADGAVVALDGADEAADVALDADAEEVPAAVDDALAEDGDGRVGGVDAPVGRLGVLPTAGENEADAAGDRGVLVIAPGRGVKGDDVVVGLAAVPDGDEGEEKEEGEDAEGGGEAEVEAGGAGHSSILTAEAQRTRRIRNSAVSSIGFS